MGDGTEAGSGTTIYDMSTNSNNGTMTNMASDDIVTVVPHDENFYANQNWQSTGSLANTVTGNLYVGTTYTGSLTEFRVWDIPLSSSKFKQHMLNPFSVVGNHITSSQYDLKYHYKFDENWKATGSDGIPNTNPKIYDANFKNVKDYSKSFTSSLLSTTALYDRTQVPVVKFSIRGVGGNQPNSNKILTNPPKTYQGNLDPFKRNSKNIYSDTDKGRNVGASHRNTSIVDFTKSPQDVLNDFIINHLPDFDISDYYSDPDDLYSDSYVDLDKLRDDLFTNYNVSMEVNKWVRAQSGMFNKSFIGGIQKLLPGRTTTKDVGVSFKPTLLERSKYKHKKPSIEYGSPGINGLNIGINITTSSFGLTDSSYNTSKDGEVGIDDIIIKKITYESSKDGEYNIKDNIIKKITYESSKDAEYNVEDNISKEMEYNTSKDAEYNVEDNITKEITYKSTYDGTDTWMSDKNQESFVNLLDSWGTSSNDTHFVNYAGPKDSDGFYDTNHFESRYTFTTMGDVETISSSLNAFQIAAGTNIFGRRWKPYYADHTDINNFHNRMIIDKGKGYTYNSYINGTGPQNGRAIGKTAYFSQSADGRISYPSNHWINYGDPFVNNMHDGTQFQGGYYFTAPHGANWTDLSTASFYSVSVNLENELKVIYNKPTIGRSGNIINK